MFHDLLTLANIQAAAARISPVIQPTPLLPLHIESDRLRIFLKLETVHPTGSFKLRGATNALLNASQHELANGVYTASSGNMAQAVAWMAARMDLDCFVVVPDSAPQLKVERIQALGAEIVQVPFDEWWQILLNQEYTPFADKFFVHPSSQAAVMTGYGTIGLEILNELPDTDTVIIPWGSGGLCGGIGSVFRHLRPAAQVYAAEVDTGAPLAASLASGQLQSAPYTPTFIDGISAPSVMAEMLPLAQQVLDGSLVVSLPQVCDAIRIIAANNHLIVEGAGAAPVAAALAEEQLIGNVVCVVTGGNLDFRHLTRILQGELP
jgi:threonine dehydratase